MMVDPRNVLVVALALIFSGVFGQDIPTLIPPTNFDPVSDAAALYDAMVGLGTDENKIIDVLCYRSFEQRAEITDAYYTGYGNLLVDLQDDLRGEFLDFTTMLTYDKGTFFSIQIHNVMAGFGTNEPTMTEIIIPRTNQEHADMQVAYAKYYGTPLLAAIEGEVSGSLRDLYVMIVQGSRDEGTVVDPTLVSRDVLNLYNAGEGSVGTNEKVFVEVLGNRNWNHMREVADQYDATYGSLEMAIITEFNNVDAQNALCTIVRYSRNKAAYFANRFFLALDGFGTSNVDLDRLTISRSEIDLGNIETEYENIYRVSLRDAITSDTAGSHQKGLLVLLG